MHGTQPPSLGQSGRSCLLPESRTTSANSHKVCFLWASLGTLSSRQASTLYYTNKDSQPWSLFPQSAWLWVCPQAWKSNVKRHGHDPIPCSRFQGQHAQMGGSSLLWRQLLGQLFRAPEPWLLEMWLPRTVILTKYLMFMEYLYYARHLDSQLQLISTTFL